jgi:hypothetical protein
VDIDAIESMIPTHDRHYRPARLLPKSLALLAMLLLTACMAAPESAANSSATGAVNGAAKVTEAAPLPPATTAIAATPVTRGQHTYHIGNSLTDTINDNLSEIARSAGYAHEYLRSTIPGAPTDWNWDHPGQAAGEPDYRTVFEMKAPIDHLFTQPFAGHNRSIDNEVEYSGKFYRLARQKSPQVQMWIYAQWPSQKFDDNWAKATESAGGLGRSPAKTWEEGVANHLAYHEAVRQRLEQENPGKSVWIVPGGLALANLKRAIEAGQVPGIKDFFSSQFEDNVHLNNKGAYLIALVHYACIYKRDPTGVSLADSGLTPEQAAVYQRIAWDTVRNYRWSGMSLR